MEERVAVVTGATSGVGRATAIALARRGFRVVGLARDAGRADDLRSSMKGIGAGVETIVADLSLASGVHAAAAEITDRHPRLHLLVNNAGAVYAKRAVTSEGHERTLALNVLAPYLLTRLVEPNLRSAGGGARVVHVASDAHFGARLDLGDLEARPPYHGFRTYSRSKVALILLAREFAVRTPPSEVAHFAVHPGFVRTRFGLQNGGAFALGLRLLMVFAISPTAAARTVVFAATSHELEGATGLYLARERRSEASPEATDAATGARLWGELARITGLPA